VTVGRCALSPALAAQEIKPHLIHETVLAELAERRAGTHSTKNRAEVRGGGAKPWRQKGTGRARHGSIRSPLWTGGGVTFGPTPRSHGGKVNRKVRAQAFRSALRAHAERGSAALMETPNWREPSTGRAAEYLRQAPDGLRARPLTIVLEDGDGVVARSFRNLRGVTVIAAGDLATTEAMSARSLLVERPVWERLVGEGEVEPVEGKRKAKPRRKAPPKPKPVAVVEEPEAEEAAEPEPEAAAPEAEETEAAPAADAGQADEPEDEEAAAESEADEPEDAGEPDVESVDDDEDAR
jgi:large subunit ribosomal protein L4